MTRYTATSSPTPSRAGLAPLEFVLALPILAILMALMINYGVAAAWKVRTQGNAHYAGFRTLLVRTGDWNGHPANWPNATLSAGTGAALPTVSQLWDAHPDTSHPRADWIRGSWLTSPSQIVPVHVEGRLEFDAGVHTGTASMQRPLPLLRGALPTGQFGFNLTLPLFDNRWQFHSLGIGDNRNPRTRVWWDIEEGDLAALDSQILTSQQRLLTAYQRLLSNPRPQYLQPLDQDVEFRIYSGNTPDFYPRVGGCSADVQFVRMTQVAPLVDRINRLPCDMSRRYCEQLYRPWIERLERCGANDRTIQPLRDRYNDLRQLVNALPNSMGCGSVPALMPQMPCDPADLNCLSQCPAPIPDLDGL